MTVNLIFNLPLLRSTASEASCWRYYMCSCCSGARRSRYSDYQVSSLLSVCGFCLSYVYWLNLIFNFWIRRLVRRLWQSRLILLFSENCNEILLTGVKSDWMSSTISLLSIELIDGTILLCLALYWLTHSLNLSSIWGDQVNKDANLGAVVYCVYAITASWLLLASILAWKYSPCEWADDNWSIALWLGSTAHFSSVEWIWVHVCGRVSSICQWAVATNNRVKQ